MPAKTKKKAIGKYTTPRVKQTKKKGPGEVQAHGKIWETSIIGSVVLSDHLEEALRAPHTAVHDINKAWTPYGKHMSIKATGSKRVDFGDAKRTLHNIKKGSPLEAIIIRYKQNGNRKIPTSVIRLDMTKNPKALLGCMSSEELYSDVNELDAMVKSGNPRYKSTAAKLREKMKKRGSSFSLAPKIGNPLKKRVGRLQISLANIDAIIDKHPELIVEEKDCSVYGNKCLMPLISGRRVVNSSAVAFKTPKKSKAKAITRKIKSVKGKHLQPSVKA